MSPRLPGNRVKPAAQRNEGTWLALIFLLVVSGGLLGLVSMILPDIFNLVSVLLLFVGFIALHYFTWGRWLMQHAATEDPVAPRETPGESQLKGPE